MRHTQPARLRRRSGQPAAAMLSGFAHLPCLILSSSPLVCRATKARSARAAVRRWVVAARPGCVRATPRKFRPHPAFAANCCTASLEICPRQAMSTPDPAFLRPADGVATELLSLRAVEGENAPRLRCAARMSTASKYCWTVASQLIHRGVRFQASGSSCASGGGVPRGSRTGLVVLSHGPIPVMGWPAGRLAGRARSLPRSPGRTMARRDSLY